MDEGGTGCCCNDCAPGELVEAQTKGRDSAEHLEKNVAGRLLAGAQNAAGIVLDALQDDGESEDSKSQGKPDTGGHSWVQVDSYHHHSHITVKMVGVFVAVGLMVSAVLDMVGFASTESTQEPFDYVHNIWNLFFGVLMILMDAPKRWLGKLQPWQTTLFQKAHLLARARGRALVHFYVGIINLAMADFMSFSLWTIIHLSRGGALVVCSVIMLLNHHTYHCQRRSHVRNLNQLNQVQAGMAGAAVAVKANEALHTFEEEALEVRTYISKNHCTVQIFAFLCAIALVGISIFGMINIFTLILSPFHYTIGAFNLLFAVVIVLVDGEASWFAKCGNCRGRLFEGLPCLAELPGRSLLHFYVGSINIVMLPGMPLDIFYISLGGSLMLCSLLMLLTHNYCLHIPALPALPGITQ